MKNTLLTYVETAVNAYLRQDEHSAARLASMAGKTICIELLPGNIQVFCRFTCDRMVISLEEETTHISKITGTPLQLCAVMLAKENRQQYFAEDIQIEGDAEFAQQVTDLFDQVNIDWEELAAKWIGDVPAVKLSKLTSHVKQWLKKAGDNLTQDVNDYIHEEKAWFPVRSELQSFFDDIDTMRMDVDRLEARLNHLRSQLEKENGQ